MLSLNVFGFSRSINHKVASIFPKMWVSKSYRVEKKIRIDRGPRVSAVVLIVLAVGRLHFVSFRE